MWIFNMYCTMFCNNSMCIQCTFNDYSIYLYLICIAPCFAIFQCVFNVHSMIFYSSYLFPFLTPYTISYYLFLSHITLSFVHQANIRSLIYMLHRSCGHHHSQLSWWPDTSSDGTSCLRARVLIFPRKSNNIQKIYV